MTSASRPTWTPAQGGGGLRDGTSSAPTFQYSSRDLAAHTKLKLRQLGQDAPEEVQARNLAEELLHLERTSRPQERRTENGDGLQDEDFDFFDKEKQEEEETLHGQTDQDKKRQGAVDELEQEQEEEGEAYKRQGQDQDDEDDTEELLRELEKIKKEREEEKLLRQKAEAERHEAQVLRANPLLNPPAPTDSFAVKRRWDDDVVFKNQGRGVEDKPKKRFINDMIRSDFHRKFLDRYIK